MPRPHRRVANFKFQEFLGGVKLRQSANPTIFGEIGFLQFADFSGEVIHAGLHQGLQGLPQNQTDQIIGRVVTTRSLAGKYVRTNDDLFAITDDLVFKQALINRTKLLDAQIPVVDVVPAFRGLFERERVDDVRHDLIAKPDVCEQRRPFPVK